MKNLTAFGLAIPGLVAVGQPNAKAADFKKLYGTWVSNGDPPNSAGWVAYAHAGVIQPVR